MGNNSDSNDTGSGASVLGVSTEGLGAIAASVGAADIPTLFDGLAHAGVTLPEAAVMTGNEAHVASFSPKGGG